MNLNIFKVHGGNLNKKLQCEGCLPELRASRHKVAEAKPGFLSPLLRSSSRLSSKFCHLQMQTNGSNFEGHTQRFRQNIFAVDIFEAVINAKS